MSCGNPSLPALLIARRGFAGTGRKGWLAWIGSCLERNSQRRTLSELDDHLLKDIGITRLQALKEAGKPAWHA